MNLNIAEILETQNDRYGVLNKQIYEGVSAAVVVVDAITFASKGDVIVRALYKDGRVGEAYRIDSYKLAMVRYDYSGFDVTDDEFDKLVNMQSD